MLLQKLLLILLVAVCGLAQAAAAASTPVGEVTFVIGVGRLTSAGERVVAVTRGMAVAAGDRIETESGGHVHIRFVDGAFVSVRPGSRLGIEAYQFDAAKPQDSAIRFKLEQGVVRAISGQGAEAARERFRLNTPIAAIGVRGTDFVVQSAAEQVRVAVHSGAIVMAPFGDGCLADALGPCATAASRQLSADMGQVVLEFQRQQGVPRLVPLKSLPGEGGGMAPPAPEEPRAGLRRNEVATDTLANRAVENRTVVPVTQITPGPPVPAPPEPLVWGRWTDVARAGDVLTEPWRQAAVGRSVVVGDDYYVLFRSGSANAVIPTLGRAEFSLGASQAFLVTAAGSSPGQVDNGWLSIDFGTAKFATGLTVSHPSVGSVGVSAAGNVRDDGWFVARSGSALVAGGVTIDGKQAAYLFQQQVSGGMLSGTTKWTR